MFGVLIDCDEVRCNIQRKVNPSKSKDHLDGLFRLSKVFFNLLALNEEVPKGIQDRDKGYSRPLEVLFEPKHHEVQLEIIEESEYIAD